MSFLVHWLIVGVALWVTTQVLSGVHISSFNVLVLSALVLGLVNALVRP